MDVLLPAFDVQLFAGLSYKPSAAARETIHDTREGTAMAENLLSRVVMNLA